MTKTPRFDALLRRQRYNLATLPIVGALVSLQVLWTVATLF